MRHFQLPYDEFRVSIQSDNQPFQSFCSQRWQFLQAKKFSMQVFGSSVLVQF